MAEAKKKTEKTEAKEEAILDKEMFVEIKGVRYKMNRLNLRTMIKMGSVLSVGAAMMGTNLTNIEELTPQSMAAMFLGGAFNAEDQMLGLLAHLLLREDEEGNWVELTKKEILDPDKFPMSAILPIVEGLVENQDIKSFFADFVAFMKRPAMKHLWQKVSI
ncbi:MAG TPA: hypothetical protein P5539_15615 [Mesotoga sp.]|nr:hypothetical protein [Mesotoga sp.]